MSKPYKIPTAIAATCDELTALVEENPRYIPPEKAAKFLGMNSEGLRCSMEKGQCPFGFAWQKDPRGYKGFKIPTVTFYFWVMNMKGLPLQNGQP
ncbi:hypothetical protein DSECCO2_547330 [anaerobic digester metagenome]